MPIPTKPNCTRDSVALHLQKRLLRKRPRVPEHGVRLVRGCLRVELVEVLNEAERLDMPVSRVALQTFDRGRHAQK